ncbi:MAG: DUF459 domain-containing protein [Hyphomicrobiaceae bacterium]|nr:MAG: DUF459 domain-containing protein [Hyphomicrobiaceae bacterium]
MQDQRDSRYQSDYCGAAGWLAAVLALLMAVLALTPPARAQGNVASFITPFPEKETYRLMVFGDVMADGLAQGLIEAFEGEEKLGIVRKSRPGSSLARKEPFDWSTQLKELIGKDAPHIAVFVFGARERQPFVNVRTEEMERRRDAWRADFSKRVDLVMKALRRTNTAIYWVGAPILKSPAWSEDLQLINSLIREKVYVNGGKFVDTWSGFTDENGLYSQFGPDLSGKVRQLREGDGILFTHAGYRKLAHFVEREIRRDLIIAKSERNIPLAGSEAEQRRVNPHKTQWTTATAVTPQQKTAVKPADAKAPVTETEPAIADQKAENSKVTFTVPASEGKQAEQVTIEIVRPSIPAQVIAHVMRRKETQKAQQIGETIRIDYTSGLTTLSTLTTAPNLSTGVTRRTTTSTDALPYRVMIRGEKLPPKKGRADDFSWPRPDALPPG